MRAEVVSFSDEPLILVNSNDEEVGFLDKETCHNGDGKLHRAFSVFIFNSEGKLLLQQRASGKRLWGGYWANTCCSHPRQGESVADAALRRLKEEVGLDASLRQVFSFEYHARFKDLGSEHELCHVLLGKSDADPDPNTSEIDALRWVSADELDAELSQKDHTLTPWLAIEWKRLRSEFKAELGELGVA